MLKLHHLLDSLISLGVHDGLPNREKIKIRLINKLGIVGMVTTIALLIIVRGFLDIGSPLRNLGTISIIVLGGFFHYMRLYSATRIMLCIIYPAYIALLCYYGGHNTAQLNLLILVAIMIFIQYDSNSRLKVILLLYVFLIGIGSHFIGIHTPNKLELFDSYTNHISIFSSTLFLIALIIYFYQVEIKRFGLSNDRMLSELKTKNIELERFAYVTSHDLKEPIRNISSLATVLEKSIDDKTEIIRNQEMIDLVEVSSIRMSSLIDSILNFSKIDSEEFFSEAIDINVLITDFVQSHDQFLKDRNAKVLYRDLPTINGNRVFLSLLFQNLIKNGIEHNEVEEPLVSLYSIDDVDNHRIIVEDNGLGIDQDFHKYIFEPFKKLNNNLVFQGSGLGLSICKKIVEYHDGEIEIESSNDAGSKFLVKLPKNRGDHT